MKSVLMIAVATVALIAGAARAQTTLPAQIAWTYHAIPGGALGYESLPESDIATGVATGQTVIFFHIPQQQKDFAFTFQVENMAIECRGQRFRVLQSRVYDASGKLLAEQGASEWKPVPPNHPIGVFKRVWCNNQRPPTAKYAPDLEALFLAMRSLPVTFSAAPAPPPPPAPAPMPVAPAASPAPRPAPPAVITPPRP